jgi:cytochrome c oxidase subunit II
MTDLLHLPVNASAHGARIDQIIVYIHILMVAIFVGWSLFFAYTLWRFRRKKNPKADYAGVKKHTSTYVEAAVVLAEVVLLVGFSIPFWATQVDARPAEESNPFEVRVVAQQFSWSVHYPGVDGIFGRTSPDLVDSDDNPLGIDKDDPNAVDDIYSPGVLRLPKGRQALVHLTTRDVIHSFFLPEFRVKQDVIPGMSIPVHFTPTMTTEEFRALVGDETRDFEIACAQLCGITHYAMRGYVRVDTEENIQAWLAKKAR